jgi:DegV family protein with EDD domain
MSLRIITDSTCDLPVELVEEYQIKVLPLYIHIGRKSYMDGIDMSRQEFYSGLPAFEQHPTTASPSSSLFTQAYQQLIDEGATELLSIHISESLSAVVDVARVAARDFSAAPVTVFDSQQLSLGAGYIVLEAAKAALAGAKAAEILPDLVALTKRTYVFAALDTLEYLKRSGRMHFALATIGSLLQLKPVLKMNQGVPTSERIRTREKALNKIIKLTEELGPLERIDLVHTNAPAEAEKLHQQARHLFTTGNKPISVDVTPVLGAHLGPNVVGFSCIARRKGKFF